MPQRWWQYQLLVHTMPARATSTAPQNWLVNHCQDQEGGINRGGMYNGEEEDIRYGEEPFKICLGHRDRSYKKKYESLACVKEGDKFILPLKTMRGKRGAALRNPKLLGYALTGEVVRTESEEFSGWTEFNFTLKWAVRNIQCPTGAKWWHGERGVSINKTSSDSIPQN